ncbi:hypothetical protein, partial [Burkholderia sp. Bp8986]|uniref:hypothetical protein n=1 Tax=Burkholderia sp. Bp8986 TaxID=2184550 RepID=UPI000FADFAEF
MSVGFSLQSNSTPLDFSRKTRHELKDIFTQASMPDVAGKPTAFKGTLYHDGKQYMVTRFYEMVGGQQVARHIFSRQVDWEQSWAVVIENLFSKYVLDKTWIGQRKLENVRQEFEVLLEDAKDQSRLVVFKHGLDIDSDASLPHRKLADTATDLVACRELERSIHPAKRLDEAGYTGDARGALRRGGFQQATSWFYSAEQDQSARCVFTLKDRQTRVVVDTRLMSGSANASLAEAGATYQRLNDEITQLAAELGQIAEQLQKEQRGKPNSSRVNELLEQQRLACERTNALKRQVREMEETSLGDARQLVTFLYEKEEHDGWNLQQRRLFNALVDQMWMIGTAITWAAGECPAGRTYGTPEEIAKQTALLKQYG